MRIPSSSPRLKARVAGLLYLLVFVIGPRGASSATPTNVIGMLVCDVGVALILRLSAPTPVLRSADQPAV